MPWNNIRRYLSQPRLRLAWIIPFGRSTFWTTFFVYPPLYIVQQGGSEAIVAVMLSTGQGLLFCAPFLGRLGQRHGIRRIIIAAARSEEHTSELQSLMRISYAVFCLKKKKNRQEQHSTTYTT